MYDTSIILLIHMYDTIHGRWQHGYHGTGIHLHGYHACARITAVHLWYPRGEKIVENNHLSATGGTPHPGAVCGFLRFTRGKLCFFERSKSKKKSSDFSIESTRFPACAQCTVQGLGIYIISRSFLISGWGGVMRGHQGKFSRRQGMGKG